VVKCNSKNARWRPQSERHETKPRFILPVFYCWFLTNQQIFGIFIAFCCQRWIPKRWTYFCESLSQAGRGRRMLRKNTLVMPIISLNSFNTKVVFWVVQWEEKLYFAQLCAIWNAWLREYAWEIYCNFPRVCQWLFYRKLLSDIIWRSISKVFSLHFSSPMTSMSRLTLWKDPINSINIRSSDSKRALRFVNCTKAIIMNLGCFAAPALAVKLYCKYLRNRTRINK